MLKHKHRVLQVIQLGTEGQKGQRILNFLRVRICACVRKAFLENLCPQCPSVPNVNTQEKSDCFTAWTEKVFIDILRHYRRINNTEFSLPIQGKCLPLYR